MRIKTLRILKGILPIFLVLISVSIESKAQDSGYYSMYKVNEVELEFYHKYWYNKLKAYKKRYQKKRVPAKLLMNGTQYDSVGVRFKGNSSFYSPLKKEESKLPFNIDSDKYIDGQHYLGKYEKLKLSNGFSDPSYIREVLAYRIARDYMIAPNANFAYLKINKADVGLYTSTEAIDIHFLERRFGYSDGVFIKCDPEWHQPHPKNCERGENSSLEYLGDDPNCYRPYYEIKQGGEDDWKELIKLTKTLTENPKEVSNYINVDAVLWMHAFNTVFVNLDSYTGRFCHNYYLFQDSFGVFQPLIWDMNMSFGGFRFTAKATPLSYEEMNNLSVFLHVNNKQRPLIKNLLFDEDNRLIYIDHVRTLFMEWIHNDRYKEVADSIAVSIFEYVVRDTNGLYDPINYRDYLHKPYEKDGVKVPGVFQLMQGRKDYLSEHAMVNVLPSEIEHIKIEQRDSSVVLSAMVLKANRMQLYYRNVTGAPYAIKEILNEEELESWPVEFSIDRDSILEYYFVAFTDKTAKVLPSKGAFSPFRLVK